MTWLVDQDGAVVGNDADLTGNPAVRITGDGVSFTNRAKLASTQAGVAAVVIEGSGVTIRNQAGAEIWGAGSGADRIAIQGSAAADTLIDAGLIAGLVDLGEGADTFVSLRDYWAQPIELGAGDDVYRHETGGQYIRDVHGGDGWDRMVLNTYGFQIRNQFATGFEQLEVGVGANFWNLQGFSGYQKVVVSAGASVSFIQSVNPDADITIAAGAASTEIAIASTSVFRNVNGTSANNGVTLTGTVLGDITLGEGIDHLLYLDFLVHPSVPTVGGIVDGGAGVQDWVSVQVEGVQSEGGATVDLANIVGFEIFDAATSVRVLNVDGFLDIRNYITGKTVIAESHSPDAVVWLRFPSTLVLESTVTVGRIGEFNPLSAIDERVYPESSATLVNQGHILGDVYFHLGHDIFDGSLGTVGGTIYGLAGDDVLTAGAESDTIEGGFGNDRIDGGPGADTLIGGTGDDDYFIDISADRLEEESGGGIDTVHAGFTFRLPVELENLVLTGAEAINGYGNDSANRLSGNGGANRLDGGAGADELAGGKGDDVYAVDDAGDAVIEATGGGFDTIESRVSYALPDHVEQLVLTGTAFAGTGNGGANSITGNMSANLLNGAAGADTLRGLGGDDVYVVDATADAVVEMAEMGNDTVRSSANHTLPDHVESLILTGGGDIRGSGNALANSITGNAGNNRLNGAAGADTLAGGKGHDTYVVNNPADQVIEAGSSGNDTVESSVSYGLSIHVEKLVLTGSFGIDGRGNAGANTLTGNAGGNFLNGGRGNDVIDGGGGNDQLMGNLGNDDLRGRAGDDRFYFNVAAGAANADDILDFAAADDSLYLLRSIFTRAGPNGTLDAAAFHSGGVAADADDRILYDAATGNIFYDADGTGAAAALLFATVDAGTALTHADFMIYG